jgi:diguanylate cyclase (GGDEF)-like protein
VLGGVFAVAYIVYLVIKPGDAHSVTVTSDVIQLVIPLCLTVPMALAAARRSVGREQTAWLLFAGAAFAWGAGQSLWTWFEVVGGEDAPFPSLADVGFLLAVPLLLAGVVVYPARLLALGRARVLVDAGLIASAALFSAYGTFLGEIYENGEGSPLAQTISLAYPVGDVVIVSAAIALLARRVDGWRGAIGLVILGTTALAVADSSFAYLISRGDYTDGATDAGWVIGFLLIGYASAVRPVGVVDGPEPDEHRGPTMIEAALPVLPVAVAALVLAQRGIAGEGVGPFLGVVGAVVCLFVVLRTVIIQVENARLTADLAQSVEALRVREDELHHQAFHDAHTGLANRALFRDRLEHSVAKREHDVVVLFIDLDDFKTVNDSLGHDVGDHLLALVAERLRACVRPGDTVARLGGDEFGVLVDDPDAASRAELLAGRILAALEVPFAVAGRELRVQASIGVALGAAGISSAASLLQDADLAMYGAKGAGKATYMRFHGSLRDEARDRMDLLHDLDRALEHGQLEVHYQPVVRLPSRELAGYEALVRWRHPTRGLLTPTSFLDLAEETGAVVPIGWWVLEQACIALVDRDPGHGERPLWLAVNLSPRQLRDPDVTGTVGAILATTGLDPTRLFLELSESSLLDDESSVPALRALQALGLRLAIDDFGTGYSSLAALAGLPLDAVKIDRTFVARMRPDGQGDSDLLIRAIAQIADGLGLRIVAEGVEQAFQLERLAELGCHGAQGYLIGRPTPFLAPVRDISRS